MNKLINNIIFPTALMGTVTTMIVMPAQTINSQVPIERVAKPVTVLITAVVNNKEREPGSGVIVAKQDNTYTVATASHVISGTIAGTIGQLEAPSVSIIIKTSDGQEHKVPATQAKFLLGKEENDLAVIQFTSNKNYKTAEIVDSDDVSNGTAVFVCGFPLPDATYGTTFTMTDGRISGINKNDKYGYHFQYTAPTRVGMSGGPVFNQYGQVIAIHGSALSAKTSENSQLQGKEQGFNRGMPINILQREQKKAKLNLNLQIAKGTPQPVELSEPEVGENRNPFGRPETVETKPTTVVCPGNVCKP